MNPRFSLTLRALFITPWRIPLASILERMDEVLWGSFGVVMVTVGAVGAAMCDQAAAQALRLLGDQSFIGPEYIVLGFEEFGPLVVALTLATRVGAGFAAEVASAQGDETLDALSLYGQSPETSRLAPMGLACTLGGASLGILAAAVWESTGIVTMWLRYGINPHTFFHPDAIAIHSVVLCLVKNASMGALVFISALYAGLRAKPGSEAVGHATTQAVVGGLIAVLAANFAIDVLWFVFRGPQ